MIQKLISVLFIIATLLQPISGVQAAAPQAPLADYSISGTVSLQSDAGLEGARISVQGTALSADSDAFGHYVIASVPEGLYTLQVSCQTCTGYKFSPENRQIDLQANTDSVNYLALPNETPTYTIQGTVTSPGIGSLVGVRVTYGFGLWVLTDGSGNYAISNLPQAAYTLTPDRSGYLFFPSEYIIASLSADLIGRNFTAYNAVGTTLFSISGQVAEDGAGLGGVCMTYGLDQSVTTQLDGSYLITNLPEDMYTLTPGLAEYTFSADHEDVYVGPDQIGIDFIAARHYSISGKVSLSDGTGLSGVTISYSGPESGSVVTDPEGNYKIKDLRSGTYTLTPSLAEYTFSAAQNVRVGPNKTGIDFTATRLYSISGKVSLSGGTGLGGVTIGYVGTASGSVVTSLDGTYTISGLHSGTYTLTPSLAEYTFSAAQDVSVGPSQTGINFTATRIVYSISGKVSLSGGPGLGGVTISYSGTAAGSVVTGLDGTYTISGLHSGTYTLTPSLAEYTFSAAQDVSVGPSQTGIGFTATVVTYSIQGFIRTAGGTGYREITVEAIQGGIGIRSGMSDESGAYLIEGLTKGIYTIRPTLFGAKFRVSDTDPGTYQNVSVGPDTMGINFLIEFPVFLPFAFKNYDPLTMYADDFKTDRGWVPLYLGNGTAGVQSGAYVLKQTEALRFAGSLSPFAVSEFPDKGYDVRVKMNRVGGGDPSFGLMFEWKADNDFFLFQIDSDDQIYYIDHNGTVIANFDYSSAINIGEQMNELRVVRRQTAVDFYINGTLVVPNVPAPDLAAAGAKGKVALQLSTYSTAAEIRFTNIVISRLP